MISFENDYSEGAHEEILRRLAEVNKEGITGYGNDSYCESAKEKIRQACKCPEADIYFLVGGTQTNQTVIDSVLQSYEGVIAAETGHVASRVLSTSLTQQSMAHCIHVANSQSFLISVSSTIFRCILMEHVLDTVSQ